MSTTNNKVGGKEIRGSFTSPVTWEMVYKTFWAWITKRDIVHKDILIVPKQ